MAPSDHQILPRPWQYEITEFRVTLGEVPCLDIAFVRSGVVRRLRFLRPQGIRFEPGPQGPEGGFSMSDLRIYDVSSDGLEGLRIHVLNDGSSSAVLEFWAAGAEELGA